MTPTFESRTVSVRIDRDPGDVYDFASAPENFTKWATGLGNSFSLAGDHWIAETPHGPVQVRFTPRNNFGILDHHVLPGEGDEIYIPMRVIANGGGSELLFTLFRLPDMTDATFAEDAAWVEKDLNALKTLLEG